MKKIILLLFFVIICSFSFADYYEETVTAKGMGSIVNKNKAKARDEAIWDAQRKAVEKGVGVFLNSETIVQNAQLVLDEIYTNSSGYVKTYNIIDEKKDSDLYEVTIEAVVKTAELGNKLINTGLIKKIGDPRIMVIIPEYHIQKPIPDPAAETAIINNLIEAGYRLVDQNQIKKIRYTEKAKLLSSGNLDAAQEIGAQFGADIIITGEAFSVKKGEIYGMISCGARVEIRAIKVDVGEIIFASSAHAADLDLSEELAAKKALRKAGNLITTGGKEPGGKYIESVTPKIAKSLLTRPSIQLIIDNITNDQFTILLKYLKDERTIKNVYSREMSGTTGRIDVDYDRTPEDLKDVINELESLTLKITSFTKNKIYIEIKKSSTLTAYGVKYTDLKNILKTLKTYDGLEVLNKKYSSKKSVIKFNYSDSIFEIAENFEENYEIEDLDDYNIIIRKKN